MLGEDFKREERQGDASNIECQARSDSYIMLLSLMSIEDSEGGRKLLIIIAGVEAEAVILSPMRSEDPDQGLVKV